MATVQLKLGTQATIIGVFNFKVNFVIVLAGLAQDVLSK